MGHSRPPLRIGFKNGLGYAKPEPFEREKSETVEVAVETACLVRFKDNTFFDDQDYDRPQQDGACQRV